MFWTLKFNTQCFDHVNRGHYLTNNDLNNWIVDLKQMSERENIRHLDFLQCRQFEKVILQ